MKTPAEFEPIALWMGWTKFFAWSIDGDWLNEDKQYRGGVANKTSLTDAEAVEALQRLSKYPKLRYVLEGPADDNQHFCTIIDIDAEPHVFFESGWQPTISAAVEGALLKLIAAEAYSECEVCGLSVPKGETCPHNQLG